MRILLNIVLAVTLFACESEHPAPQPAFYHWQTQFKIDSTEADYLQTLQVQRLYVKFFDVDWDAAARQAIPQATLIRETTLTDYAIVPTVFITNRTMRQLSTTSSTELATRILTKIDELWPGLEPPEIQIDCDWTSTTQATYFDFLSILRQKLTERYGEQVKQPQLSVTLRLHQYRYPEQTGIPPVDRAMLMFYNMGELTAWEEPNSILNLEKARPYLATEKTYPLALDIALPLFQWAVLFRNGKMIKLMPEVDAAAIRSVGGKALEGSRSTRFEIPESTYLQGYYLYAEDRIRLEIVTPELLREAAELVSGIASGEQPYISFYHLDHQLLTTFSPDELIAITDALNLRNSTKKNSAE